MSSSGERVILVDGDDVPVGEEEKLRAHVIGARHRAFSVFVFRPDGTVLLQRRAPDKYHSGGLWSNACCGHPRPGEDTVVAGRRRLLEEMGIDCALRSVGRIEYRLPVGNDLIEHECDHILVGEFAGVPQPNADEVSEWSWADVAVLERELARTPERYTAWLRLAFTQARAAISVA